MWTSCKFYCCENHDEMENCRYHSTAFNDGDSMVISDERSTFN